MDGSPEPGSYEPIAEPATSEFLFDVGKFEVPKALYQLPQALAEE
jgi:hypothetical protein